MHRPSRLFPDVAAGTTEPSASGDPVDESSDDAPQAHDAPELELLLPDLVDGIAADTYSSVRPFEADADSGYDQRWLLESAGLETSVERSATAEYGPLGFVSVSRIDSIPTERLLDERAGFLRVLRGPFGPACGIWRISERDILIFGPSDDPSAGESLFGAAMALWIEDGAMFYAASESHGGLARLLQGM